MFWRLEPVFLPVTCTGWLSFFTKPPRPLPPPFFLLFPNALLWSDDAPSVICVQRETMLCSSLLNYWILFMPAPVGQEEEQVGGSQCDQSTWNIQLWIYTSFTAAAAAGLVRNTPPKKSLGHCNGKWASGDNTFFSSYLWTPAAVRKLEECWKQWPTWIEN